MATVHPEKAVSAKTAFLFIAMYAEGLLSKCADQFQQELTIDDIEGSQYNQTQENQHKECCQSADRDHGYLR